MIDFLAPCHLAYRLDGQAESATEFFGIVYVDDAG
jgi:hypothetical protein